MWPWYARLALSKVMPTGYSQPLTNTGTTGTTDISISTTNHHKIPHRFAMLVILALSGI